MEGLWVILGVLNVVLILMFVQLVVHVAAIRKNVEKSSADYWLQDYYKQSYLKRNDAALYSLQEYVYASMFKSRNRKNYDKLKHEFEPLFINLGSTFPVYPFEK